jgi:nucleoside-diphosphate-sugar epimerase
MSLRREYLHFTWDYKVDPIKADIANSWPDIMDDSCARAEWDWAPKWGLQEMMTDMLAACKEKVDKGLY